MESAIYFLPRWYSFSKPTNLGMIGVRPMNFGDYSAPVGFKIQEPVWMWVDMLPFGEIWQVGLGRPLVS